MNPPAKAESFGSFDDESTRVMEDQMLRALADQSRERAEVSPPDPNPEASKSTAKVPALTDEQVAALMTEVIDDPAVAEPAAVGAITVDRLVVASPVASPADEHPIVRATPRPLLDRLRLAAVIVAGGAILLLGLGHHEAPRPRAHAQLASTIPRAPRPLPLKP